MFETCGPVTYKLLSLNLSPRFSRPFLNPHLAQLHPYPFERLRALFASVAANPHKRPISLSIGEPRHPTPPLLLEALANGSMGLANYPKTAAPP